MRLAYLVAYDISDPKRLRRVHRTMRGYGDALCTGQKLNNSSERKLLSGALKVA